jgi:hypothetical protein
MYELQCVHVHLSVLTVIHDTLYTNKVTAMREENKLPVTASKLELYVSFF